MMALALRRMYWRSRNVLDARFGKHQPADFSEQEIRIVEAVRHSTMTTGVRVVSLIRAIDYIVSNDIPGDIVECGVWKGGSMMAAALTLMHHRQTARKLYMYDTYDGMPPPTAEDRDHLGIAAADQLAAQNKSAQIWARAQIDEVRENMVSTQYPMSNVSMIQGKVEETIPQQIPDRISLLRLDTDWYESTKHELEHLFPRLVPGGVLILDDYGHWEGVRKAVDDYIAANRVRLLLCRIDMDGRIAIKQY